VPKPPCSVTCVANGNGGAGNATPPDICDETALLGGGGKITNDYLSARSCWTNPLSQNPIVDPHTKVDLQLDVIGVNHPPTSGCELNACECDLFCCDRPMQDDALYNLEAMMHDDWQGSSQILAFTGLRPQAFPCGNLTSCGSFDDCFVNGPGSEFGFSSHHVAAGTSGWSQREYAVLTSQRWKVVGETTTIIKVPATSETSNPGSTGMYHARIQDSCSSNLTFSIFDIHLDSKFDSVRQEQLAAAMDYVSANILPTEYAPILVGDFNGLNIYVNPFATKAFTQLNLCGGSQCLAGSFAGQSIPGVNGTMTVLLGRVDCGSPFRDMGGNFVVQRQSAIASSFDNQGDTGIIVPDIGHHLVGVGLAMAPRSASCDAALATCGESGQGCINGPGGTCDSTGLDCIAGVCRPCGAKQQPCCAAGACNIGLSCDNANGTCQAPPPCPPHTKPGSICWKVGDPLPVPKPPCKAACVSQ
jgi:hypothetical protein